MIINDENKFVWVHIPKCAGSSIRSALKEFDSTNGFFGHPQGYHPELGQVDMAHIPLFVLREFYSDEYYKIKDYFSVAVLRDPYERFPSSFFQHLKMYGEKPFYSMSKNDLITALDNTMRALDSYGSSVLLPYKYIHFQNQSSYIFDQGERLINSLYTTDDIRNLISDIEEILGEKIISRDHGSDKHSNRTFVYRSEIVAKIIPFIKPFILNSAYKRMPDNIRKLVRKTAFVPRETKSDNLFSSQEVRSFVSEYYSDDIILYNSFDFSGSD